MVMCAFGTSALANGSDCEGSPDTPDTPDVSAVSVSVDSPDDGIGNLTKGCDTDWERATYRECFGLEYDLYLQDHPYLSNQWTTRTGFKGINM